MEFLQFIVCGVYVVLVLSDLLDFDWTLITQHFLHHLHLSHKQSEFWKQQVLACKQLFLKENQLLATTLELLEDELKALSLNHSLELQLRDLTFRIEEMSTNVESLNEKIAELQTKHAEAEQGSGEEVDYEQKTWEAMAVLKALASQYYDLEDEHAALTEQIECASREKMQLLKEMSALTRQIR